MKQCGTVPTAGLIPETLTEPGHSPRPSKQYVSAYGDAYQQT